jgi:poly-gamma-glutamate capsule biosynthesis protein CapA/YwtB (metallophosphatase superfamily)
LVWLLTATQPLWCCPEQKWLEGEKQMRSQLPSDARELMTHSPARKALYRIVFALADAFGFWDTPRPGDPENWGSIRQDMYWLYKSARPVVKPGPGVDLAVFSAANTQLGRSLLPEGLQPEASASVSAVGDLMNTKGLEDSQRRLYERVADLVFGPDISVGNLESTLTRDQVQGLRITPGVGPKINATEQQYLALKRHEARQYTILQTANNHVLDQGMEGFDTTHDRLAKDGILYVGANRSAEDQQRGLIVESNGVKFGFVAATYSVNHRPFPDDKDYLVNLIRFHKTGRPVDLSLLEEQIDYCRSQRCDFIFACLHWGFEWEFFPRQEQIEMAHHLVEYGADAIIGHHAHNIQPFEIYRTERDPQRLAPILYNLGNLSAIVSAPFSVLSLVANMTVVKGRSNGVEKTLVDKLNLTPVVQMEYDLDTTPFLRLEMLRDALAEAAHDEEWKAYLEQAARYADLVLGKSWR